MTGRAVGLRVDAGAAGPGTRTAVVVCNFTPVERVGYRLAPPPPPVAGGHWREGALNSRCRGFTADRGAGANLGGLTAEGRPPSRSGARARTVYLPPLSTLVFVQGD